MTITNQNAYTNDNGNWVHSTFIVSLGESYDTYLAQVTHQSMDETFGTVAGPAIDPTIQSVLSQVGDNQPTPVYFTTRKCRDTSLGGNDAINPYYQYNETDDVMHPFHYANAQGSVGMGRVYSETIDDHQQVMYMSFGIPVFNSLAAFYEGAANASLADLMQKGPGAVSAQSIGRLLGSTIGTLVEMPVMGLMYLDQMLSNFTSTKITKYYDFRSQMPMYYKFVQTMLVNLAVNLGMMDDGYLLNNGLSSASSTPVTPVNSSSETTAAANAQGNSIGVPDFINDYQLDIFRILNKRYVYEKGQAAIKYISTDQAVQNLAGSEMNATTPDQLTWTQKLFNPFFLSFGAALTDSQLFIGFKVEKGVDTSESLSNQTGQSEIAITLNSKMQAARSAKFSTANGNVGGILGSIVSGTVGAATGVLSGLADSFGLGGLSALATGSGMIDIPEVWQDSTFSKNYSFRMQLRSPYGDPFSILQSEYVPLACILAGALPRAIGASSYASPFLVRAYCKGMFSVPLGIIDSVSINRGGDIHGWSVNRLPTAIDVSFTIKDMSPAMYMAIGDSAQQFKDIVGANSSFQEYLATLSGLGISERLTEKINLARKTQIFLKSLYYNRLSPFSLGMTLGSKPIVRSLFSIIPVTKYLPK